MLLITNEVASRLETAEAIDAAGCAESQCRMTLGCDSAVKAIGGGIAVYCGVDSPLTHSVGVGMHGPVSESDLDELEAFFEEREVAPLIDVCPHAHPSLKDLLSARGYKILEFVNIMARSLSSEDVFPFPDDNQVTVRRANHDELELYVQTVIGGFFGREHLSGHERNLGMTIFHMPCGTPYLGFLEGRAAGGGAMSIRNRVANLFGDATDPACRGRGMHAAVIRARMTDAIAAGCDLIAAGAVPGSESQRHYEKLGFQVAYTKVTMVLH